MYLLTTIIGVFVFNQHKKLREHILFSDSEILQYAPLLAQGKQIAPEQAYLQKFKTLQVARDNPELLHELSLEQFTPQFNHANTLLTKYQLQQAVTTDHIIIQTIHTIEDVDKTLNLLTKRLRDWVSLTAPRLEHDIDDHETFLNVLEKKGVHQDDLGAPLDQTTIKQITTLNTTISSLHKTRIQSEQFLEKIMKTYCPNVQCVAGTIIGAKLLSIAGSLRKMVMMPASTIQLLGAEKALFRHMVTGAKPPRHGVIVNHPLIAQSSQKEHGKRARALADKISIAAKMDFFKGEFIGAKLLKDLEERFQ